MMDEQDRNKKRNKRQDAWKKENGERINILFKKGTKQRINMVRGDSSISEYVRKAVDDRIDKDMQSPSEEKTPKKKTKT